MRACVAPPAFAVASRARRRATTVATRDGVVVAPVAPVARARADVDRARCARPRRARTHRHRHRVAVARRAAPADEELARTFVWDAFDVFAAYGALALALGIGGDGALEHWRYGYVPYFAALAMAAIYIGSHRGLTRDFRETISFESSLLGPFVLSAALFAAYVALEVLKLDISSRRGFLFFHSGHDRGGGERDGTHERARGVVEGGSGEAARARWMGDRSQDGRDGDGCRIRRDAGANRRLTRRTRARDGGSSGWPSKLHAQQCDSVLYRQRLSLRHRLRELQELRDGAVRVARVRRVLGLQIGRGGWEKRDDERGDEPVVQRSL